MPVDPPNPYELLARAIVAWNRIETYWHLIFVSLLDCPRDQADAIYLSLANFSPQRAIGRAVAQISLANHTTTLERVNDLESAIGEEVGRRNALVHSRYVGSTGSFNLYVDEHYRSTVTKNDLTNKDIMDELTSTVRKWDELDKEAWTTLASVCAALGREMP